MARFAVFLAALCVMASLQPALGQPPRPVVSLDVQTKASAITQIASLLRSDYVDPAIGEKAASAILDKLSAGEYGSSGRAGEFAAQVTADLRGVAPDLHLALVAPRDPIEPANTSAQAPLVPSLAGFEHIEMLPGNVGYVDITGFPPKQIFGPAADYAFRQLSGARAIILDLRHNRGGSPASVAYLCSFFFDPARPVHLNDIISRAPGTRDFKRQEYWTEPTGSKFPRAPVYVLVSATTFSAGEEAAYDLQAQGRAKIVGELTGGGANPTHGHAIPGGLLLLLPYARAENPITKGNWEGVGVRPDVAVPAGSALQAAAGLLPSKRATVGTPRLLLTPRTQAILPDEPYPGSEALLRSLVLSLASGASPSPPMDQEMSEFSGSRNAWPSDIAGTGAIREIRFHGFDPFGGENFTVVFEKRTTEWTLFLTPDGRMMALAYRP